MIEAQALVATFFDGWQTYQTKIITALQPLTAEQLALGVDQGLRSISAIAKHMIGARARWFYLLMGEGGEPFADMATWDRPGKPERSAAELVDGLEATWKGMHEAIARWSASEWQQTYPGDEGDPEIITRSWVIWHLIEHDLHHGGEISLTLGRYGLPAPDL